MYMTVYDFDNEKFFAALKESRSRAGMTQSDVESRLDLRPRTMRDYESGRIKLPVEVATKLANLYNTKIEEMLGLEPYQSIQCESGILIDMVAIGIFKDVRKMEVMLSDPVIRAVVDQHEIKLTDTIFDLVTEGLSNSQREQLVVEIVRMSNSLIAIDGKVTMEELHFRNTILDRYMSNANKEELERSKKYFYQTYFPQRLVKGFERNEVKHLVVWILFFLSAADNEIDYREERYILELCEHIQLSKFNYEFIQNKFNEFLATKERR